MMSVFFQVLLSPLELLAGLVLWLGILGVSGFLFRCLKRVWSDVRRSEPKGEKDG
jgi:hypothetical protein